MVLEGYKLYDVLRQTIIQSQLSINDIYWITKDVYNEIEKLYMDQLKKEIQEEQKNDAMDNE